MAHENNHLKHLFSGFEKRLLDLNLVSPEFITHETPTPRETRGWRHLVFILRSTTPLTYQNR